MEPAKKDKGESLWQQMLESMLTQKTEKVGNLLWCGCNKAGKKKLISAIQDIAKHHKHKQHEDVFKSLEKVYIMDFKYVKINKTINDYTEEQSKLNFYILNKQYEYMKEFLTTDILSNLMAVVVVDLEDPKAIRDSLDEWIVFLKNCIRDYVDGLHEDKRRTILKNLHDVKSKMRNLSNFSSLDGYNYETGPISVQVNIDDHDEDVRNEQIELEIPLLIIGNKTDTLDKINDEKLFEYMQYVLREAAVKHNAIAITTSGHADRNVQVLYKTIGNVMIDLKTDDLTIFEPSYNILKMFVPLGVDDMQQLNSQIPYADNYIFKDNFVNKQDLKKVEKSDVKDIGDFLTEINKGQFTFLSGGDTNNTKADANRFSMTHNSSRIINDTGSSTLHRSTKFLDDANPAVKSKFDKIKGILENR